MKTFVPRKVLKGICPWACLLLYACSAADSNPLAEYRWVSMQTNPEAVVPGTLCCASWDTPFYIESSAANTFIIYGDYDSIRMCSPADRHANGRIFKRTQIADSVWKAKPSYDSLFFVGNYVADELTGFFMSYYFTKDRSSILQLHYSDPGHLNGVVLFHKDSINLLRQKDIVISGSK